MPLIFALGHPTNRSAMMKPVILRLVGKFIGMTSSKRLLVFEVLARLIDCVAPYRND